MSKSKDFQRKFFIGIGYGFAVFHKTVEQTLLKLSPRGFCVENMNNAHSTGSLLLPVLYSSYVLLLFIANTVLHNLLPTGERGDGAYDTEIANTRNRGTEATRLLAWVALSLPLKILRHTPETQASPGGTRPGPFRASLCLFRPRKYTTQGEYRP